MADLRGNTKTDIILQSLEHSVNQEKKLEVILKELEEDVARLRKTYDQAVKGANHYKQKYVQVKESKSWRYTEFVRNLKNLVAGSRRTEKQNQESKHRIQAEKKQNDGQQKIKQKNLQKRKKNPEEKRIGGLRKKLLNMGFTEKAYEELRTLAMDEKHPKLRKLAAWELMQWHGNKYTAEDASACLRWLEIALKDENDPERIRQGAIMKAECYDIMGNREAAVNALAGLLEMSAHPDVFLARANLEGDIEQRIFWINKGLEMHGLSPIRVQANRGGAAFDSLYAANEGSRGTPGSEPLVTVIMPVYKAEDVIRTAVDSVLNQSWSNLEVLVVDDCSPDGTAEIVEEYAERDGRVRLIRAEQNGGPYVARNIALREASGEYVTCHDADDWSHPDKIKIQVQHLMSHPNAIGNVSQQARATPDLKFHRRGNVGAYIFSNMSSFMFRRRPVMEMVGYWDSVRFGADSEFIRRIKQVFGEGSVKELQTGALCFQRQTGSSLTGDSAFGYHGFFMGARKEYFEAGLSYRRGKRAVYYEFPQVSRPFPVPEPLRPVREPKQDGRRHFDVIIASDFRLDGGSTLSSLEEIKAHRRMGLRTGLVQMSRYDYDPNKPINPKIREVLNDSDVQFIVYGEKVTCDLLIVRYPPVLEERQRYVPDIEAGKIAVIANQTPMSDYSSDGKRRYHLDRCERHLREYFGKSGTWYPIGPLIREAMLNHHADELHHIELSEQNWFNIIDVNWWRRTRRPEGNGKIRIGRHSRSQAVKWPNSAEVMRLVYPEDPGFEIHVLGGAEAPKKVLGKIPSNWKVWDFGAREPKEFLEGLDVFVYYTHPDLVEAFGRAILEAMAAGVPVILPPVYKPLFGDAALYAEPHEVKDLVLQLMGDPAYYQAHVDRAFRYIEDIFGYTSHSKRIGEWVRRSYVKN